MEVEVFHNVVGLTILKKTGLANDEKHQNNITNIIFFIYFKF